MTNLDGQSKNVAHPALHWAEILAMRKIPSPCPAGCKSLPVRRATTVSKPLMMSDDVEGFCPSASGVLVDQPLILDAYVSGHTVFVYFPCLTASCVI